MPIKDSARDELQRSPVTVVATVVGVAVSALALLVAWLQYAGQPTIAPSVPGQVEATSLRLSNLLLVIAFFLAVSFSFASMIRMLARRHWFSALVLSVPAAVLAGFCTLLLLHLAPPKRLSTEGLQNARDAVFYGTAFVFVAINGLPVLQDLAKPASGTPAAPSDALVGLTIALVVLLIWTGSVSSGLSRLVQIFLT